MSLSFSSRYGGKRATGKARHMEAMNEIIPNLVKAALNLPNGGEAMDDGRVNSVISSGGAETGEENSAPSSTLVLATPLSLFAKRFGCWLDRCEAFLRSAALWENASMVEVEQHMQKARIALVNHFIFRIWYNSGDTTGWRGAAAAFPGLGRFILIESMKHALDCCHLLSVVCLLRKFGRFDWVWWIIASVETYESEWCQRGVRGEGSQIAEFFHMFGTTYAQEKQKKMMTKIILEKINQHNGDNKYISSNIESPTLSVDCRVWRRPSKCRKPGKIAGTHIFIRNRYVCSVSVRDPPKSPAQVLTVNNVYHAR